MSVSSLAHPNQFSAKTFAMTSDTRLRIFILILAVGATAALIETYRASNRHVPLTDSASIGAPVAPAPVTVSATRTYPTASPAPTATASPPGSPSAAAAADAVASPTTSASDSAGTPVNTTNSQGDLRSSQARLDAIDSISQNADRLFATQALPEDFGSWSTNPQGLDQRDYQTPDGAITAWSAQDESGGNRVRAQEAQLNNGELVDRWFNDQGQVEQVMHQYNRDNSYSVYYYPTGEVQATRVVRNGAEIFTKYDRDGRQAERTQTPAGE
jgi:hypothetical protein